MNETYVYVSFKLATNDYFSTELQLEVMDNVPKILPGLKVLRHCTGTFFNFKKDPSGGKCVMEWNGLIRDAGWPYCNGNR